MSLASNGIVAVVGLGTMGKKITRLFLASNLKVLVMSKNQESGTKHVDEIRHDLMSRVTKGKMPVEQFNSMSTRMELISDFSRLGQAEVVIEAVNEEIAVKKSVYHLIEPYLNQDAILATNTSSLSVTELSSNLVEGARFVGMHFFNPPEVLRLVEVRGSSRTSQETFDKARAVAEMLGSVPLVVPDEPGYYVNRILFPMIIEGIRVYEASGGDSKDIDNAMKLGANLPMGPLELSDYIGNDIVLDICRILRVRTGESRFEPPQLLVRMVADGKLGRKTLVGFHRY